ncbi:DUF4242 domain-containing protein [Antarcticibacterium flavum]|uniref:DUF4242 domain-containing protein n=1 Tax=Antarcticibacterium flavum TaxID=2058175 RepID=A0A5B7WZP9_9FLAO|nr:MULTISPECIES: DUF4242 domain-containing protein [Antarcticibacterium]MCM4160782.1 DUF4242 domain-containing protein [Antarcticibacterium sp. W02-3]QCY68744.1 DUF4242 domain-containing protein [Antarcticibacterium flavum]
MPKFIIERDIPGAGRLSNEELKNISKNSCEVLHNLGPTINWVHSYITGNKVYCIYSAPSELMILEHARRAGLPAGSVNKVLSIIDPITAED